MHERWSRNFKKSRKLDVPNALASPVVLKRPVMTGVLLPMDVIEIDMLETVLENTSVLLGEIFWLNSMLGLGELLDGRAVLEPRAKLVL
jgi:hypothetical protein